MDVASVGRARGRAGLRPARGKGLVVCLVRPPVVIAPRSLSYYGAVPELGLAYVAAAARAAGHRVHVIDAAGLALDRLRAYSTRAGSLALQGLGTDAIVERIPDDADVIGFGHMFLHEWGVLRDLLERVRQARPNALLVAGGENASAYWDRMLEDSAALDLCVCGEGEVAFSELLHALQSGTPLHRLPSLALRERGRPIATPRVGRVVAVDALPRPAWDLFPVEHYLEQAASGGVDRGASMPVLTSRGCPYRCTFCSSPQMWTTRYHRRDPAQVVAEIEWLIETYRIRNVEINDLTSLLTKRWILEFCAALQSRSVHVTWQLPSGTRSEAVDREAAEAMMRAGCRNFCYAPESGSTEELRRMQKRVHLPALEESLRASVGAGLKTQASIILGMPDQRIADVWSSYVFVLRMARLGLHTASVLVFAPYPGSETHARLRARGRITLDERWLYGSLLRSVGSLRSYNDRLPGPVLAILQQWFLLSFFALQFGLRPWRLGSIVLNLLRGRQETVLEKLIGTKLRLLGRVAIDALHRHLSPGRPARD